MAYSIVNTTDSIPKPADAELAKTIDELEKRLLQLCRGQVNADTDFVLFDDVHPTYAGQCERKAALDVQVALWEAKARTARALQAEAVQAKAARAAAADAQALAELHADMQLLAPEELTALWVRVQAAARIAAVTQPVTTPARLLAMAAMCVGCGVQIADAPALADVQALAELHEVMQLLAPEELTKLWVQVQATARTAVVTQPVTTPVWLAALVLLNAAGRVRAERAAPVLLNAAGRVRAERAAARVAELRARDVADRIRAERAAERAASDAAWEQYLRARDAASAAELAKLDAAWEQYLRALGGAGRAQTGGVTGADSG